MSQFRQTTNTVTLTAAGGATPTLRTWDKYCSVPFKGVSIYISSGGIVTAAGDLRWTVYFGGLWAGAPYVTTSTHSAGISQASAVIAGGTELAHLLYCTNDLLPMNDPKVANLVQYSTPIVVEFTNLKAAPVTIYTTFVTELLGM